MTRIAIVGAGHAGLCVVAALQQRGIRPVVFDSADRLGDIWRGRYDGLVLNTKRDASVIPGVAVPAEMGEWPDRDAWADHIEFAATALGIDRRCEQVVAVRRAPDGRWFIDSPSVPESGWDAVVIATGRNRVPQVPQWLLSGPASIEVLHSSEFQRPSTFDGRRVLVVGGGNSGTEIAHLLSSAGVDTTISIRTMPVFAKREFLGTDLTTAARRAKHVPSRLIDLSGRMLQLILFGRLSRYGLGPPEHRLSEVEAAAGATLDSGFVDDVKNERIRVVDAVVGFEGDEIVTATGAHVPADVVIAATGSGPALGVLLPDDLVDDGWPIARHAPFQQAPGLYTAGLNPATLTAFHPDFISEAEIIADAIISEFRHR